MHPDQRAARIHYSFLPEDYADGRLEIAVRSRPCMSLGGDYCSILPLEDGRVVVCLCDAVGHDTASALYAARINTFVLAHAPRAEHPCELVERLNAFLAGALADVGLFASFFVAFLDPHAGTLEFAGAGHPPALHYRAADATVERLASEATLVGISHPAPLPCAAAARPLDPGDRVVFYTDGLVECASPAGELYGIPRLESLLARAPGGSSADFNRTLLADVERFGQGRQRDDILLLTASMSPVPGAGGPP